MYGFKTVVAVMAGLLGAGLGGALAQPVEPAPPDAAAGVRWVEAKVTAYCAGACCCGPYADGRTATGRDARLPGAAVAPDAIRYGSVLWIPGVGYRPADDTGGAMRQSWRFEQRVHVDLRCATHGEARSWGVRRLRIAVLPPPIAPARAVRAAAADPRVVAAAPDLQQAPGPQGPPDPQRHWAMATAGLPRVPWVEPRGRSTAAR